MLLYCWFNGNKKNSPIALLLLESLSVSISITKDRKILIILQYLYGMAVDLHLGQVFTIGLLTLFKPTYFSITPHNRQIYI